MKRAVVCGAGGFIASHLVKRLKRDGYWVRGVDIKEPEFASTEADEFRLLDLRDMDHCREAVKPAGGRPDRRGLSARGRDGRHGLHQHGRVRDHAQ